MRFPTLPWRDARLPRSRASRERPLPRTRASRWRARTGPQQQPRVSGRRAHSTPSPRRFAMKENDGDETDAQEHEDPEDRMHTSDRPSDDRVRGSRLPIEVARRALRVSTRSPRERQRASTKEDDRERVGSGRESVASDPDLAAERPSRGRRRDEHGHHAVIASVTRNHTNQFSARSGAPLRRWQQLPSCGSTSCHGRVGAHLGSGRGRGGTGGSSGIHRLRNVGKPGGSARSDAAIDQWS